MSEKPYANPYDPTRRMGDDPTDAAFGRDEASESFEAPNSPNSPTPRLGTLAARIRSALTERFSFGRGPHEDPMGTGSGAGDASRTSEPLTNAALRAWQRLFVGLGLAGLVLFAVLAVSSAEGPRPSPTRADAPPSPGIDLSVAPERTQRENYVRAAEERMRAIESEVARLTKDAREAARERSALEKSGEAQREALEARIEELTAELAAAKNAAENAAKNAAQTAEAGIRTGHPVGDLPIDRLTAGSGRFEAPRTFGAPSVHPTAAPYERVTDEPETGLAVMRMPKAPAPEKPAAPAPFVERDAPIALNRALGLTIGDYLPPSASVEGTLLTGGFAATDGPTANHPIPVVVKLEGPALLPNGRRTDLKGCRLTGAATGDLSSERVQIRLERLSCVGPRGEALDVKVYGYAVGSDGRVGVRGRLVTKSGEALAQALKLSLLSGVGKAVSLSTETVETSITGTQSKSYENAWKAGLGHGLSGGMERLVDYYLSIAAKLLPVVEWNPGERVDIVFSRGVHLSGG